MTDDLMATAARTDVREAAEKFKQWTILGAAADVRPGTRYQLKNRVIRKFLQYERQGTFGGINLGWTDDAEPDTARRVTRWTFARAGGGRGPVRYGEPVALAWNGDYVQYGERTIGINLEWSDTPRFEWLLLGGRPGSDVRTDTWLALFNTRSEGGEPMIYFDRTVGGDIGWPSSRTWGEALRGWAADAARKAIIEYLRSGGSA